MLSLIKNYYFVKKYKSEIKKIIFSLYKFYYKGLFYLEKRLNPTLKEQISSPSKIPVIIINFNQLFYLKKLIDFLMNRKIENIIIIDNKSDYLPLLKYYQEIESKGIIIERLSYNGGHKVFFENKKLINKYGKGFYFLTDADIVPNENLPINFQEEMLNLLIDHFHFINKVGFALRIDDIPEYFPLKQNVIQWESKYWDNKIGKGYLANTDTTFALYKPQYPFKYHHINYYKAIRLAENYTAQHGGWYIDPNHLSEEQKHYIDTASNASSWKLNNTDDSIKQRYNI